MKFSVGHWVVAFSHLVVPLKRDNDLFLPKRAVGAYQIILIENVTSFATHPIYKLYVHTEYGNDYFFYDYDVRAAEPNEIKKTRLQQLFT